MSANGNGHRRRASDRSFLLRLWEQVRENPIVALLIFCVVGMIVIVLILQFVLAPRASTNEKNIEALGKANAALIASNGRASLTQCQRANQTRSETVALYEAIAAGNRGRASAAKKLIATGLLATADPGLVYLMADRLASARESRRVLSVARELANAQRSVAKFPNAHDLSKRSIVDCHAQFGN